VLQINERIAHTEPTDEKETSEILEKISHMKTFGTNCLLRTWDIIPDPDSLSANVGITVYQYRIPISSKPNTVAIQTKRLGL
jgi:hypothetical protein